MRWPSAFLCVIGIACWGKAAAAGDRTEKPALIEEFLTTEPSYVQLAGELELSLAFDFRQPTEAWSAPLLVEYGITDRIEAEVEASYLSVHRDGSHSHGPDDVELGLHYALRPEVTEVAVTLGAELGLPTGDEARGLGSGRTEVGLLGSAGLALGRAELHVTGRLDIEDEVEPGLSAAAVLPRGAFRFTLEANALQGEGQEPGRTADPGAPATLGGETGGEGLWVVVTPGLFHRLGGEVEYGVGVPIGLTRAAPDWGVIARVTIGFEF